MADTVNTMGATMAKGAVPIPNLTDISTSGFSQGVTDTTNLSSTGGVKTSQPSGYVTRGQISIAFNYDPSDAAHVAIVTDIRTSAAATAYTITYANSDTLVADLFPISFEQSNTLDENGKLEATATFEMDGSGITDPS